MTAPESPYDDNPEARALAAEARAERLVERFRDRRPEVYADLGELHPDIVGWARRLAAGGPPETLVIVGLIGTTKTWSVWAAGEVAIRAGYAGHIEVEHSSDVREATDRPVDYPRLHAWSRCGVLVLDDMGANAMTVQQQEHLSGVFHKRWERLLPSVITSNQGDIAAMVGERAADRLAHRGRAVIVTLAGPSRRRQP
jgi:DNA replication protein DnaC